MLAGRNNEAGGRESWSAESSLKASKVNLPATEDWQTEEEMTMEEQGDRTEETVSLTEGTEDFHLEASLSAD